MLKEDKLFQYKGHVLPTLGKQEGEMEKPEQWKEEIKSTSFLLTEHNKECVTIQQSKVKWPQDNEMQSNVRLREKERSWSLK